MFAALASRRFHPSWVGTVALIACVALFVNLGQWQQGKAERKQAAQAQLQTQLQHGPISLPNTVVIDAEALRYAPVIVRGEFETAHQFLVDNRINNDVAGYHVVTPLHISGSDVRVLVNRGWIPAPANHSDVPRFDTPSGTVELTGTAVIPGNRFLVLSNAAPATQAWVQVVQNLDLPAFLAKAPWPTQPLVIELDAAAPAGFVRDWPRPDERWEKHMSYALQWYGFAATAVAIWLFVSWKKQP